SRPAARAPAGTEEQPQPAPDEQTVHHPRGRAGQDGEEAEHDQDHHRHDRSILTRPAARFIAIPRSLRFLTILAAILLTCIAASPKCCPLPWRGLVARQGRRGDVVSLKSAPPSAEAAR